MARPLTGKEELYASSRNGGRATITAAQLMGGSVIDQAYAVTGSFDEVRTLDADNYNQADVANFLATLVRDMGAAGIIREVSGG